MNIFNLFKKKEPVTLVPNKLETNHSQILEFKLVDVEKSILSNLQIDDYVSLWTKRV